MVEWGWLWTAVEEAGGRPEQRRGRVVAGVAGAVADRLGIALPDLPLLREWSEAPMPVTLPPGHVDPALVGQAAGALLDEEARRRSGAVYTPTAVADVLVAWALDASPCAHPVVCDPAVGGGAFLLAAAEALTRAGFDRTAAVGLLAGIDVDPVAAAAAQAVLALWSGGTAVPLVVVADALAPGRWPVVPDVVVGNPPFLTPLRRRADEGRRRRTGTAPAPYVDGAALFLAEAVRQVATGGVVALVLPHSFLAARDAGPVRRDVLAAARLEALWVPDAPLFEDAAARVCTVVIGRDRPRRGPLRRYSGVPPHPLPVVDADTDDLRRAPTWSHLLSDAVPSAVLEADGELGEWAEVRAGFREEYYGVAPFVVDDPGHELDPLRFPPLVTVGLIDPAVCRWGVRPARFNRRRWCAPRVDLAALRDESRLGPWADARLVPKVVVATQTKTVEAAVDEAGSWWPSTPMISVAVAPARLWHMAAALLAPPAAAWAVRAYAGTGLGHDTIRLSAAALRTLPLPAHREAWDEAAAAVREATAAPHEPARRAALLRGARHGCLAYGVDPEPLVDWWAERAIPA